MRSRSIATSLALAAALAGSGGLGQIIDNPGPRIQHEESKRQRRRMADAVKRGGLVATGRASGWTTAADKRRARKARNVKRAKARK